MFFFYLSLSFLHLTGSFLACLLHDDKPNYKRIMEYCDEVLSRDSENPKAWYRKGVALYHIQEYEEALTCLNKAKESMPRGKLMRMFSVLFVLSVKNIPKIKNCIGCHTVKCLGQNSYTCLSTFLTEIMVVHKIKVRPH